MPSKCNFTWTLKEETRSITVETDSYMTFAQAVAGTCMSAVCRWATTYPVLVEIVRSCLGLDVQGHSERSLRQHRKCLSHQESARHIWAVHCTEWLGSLFGAAVHVDCKLLCRQFCPTMLVKSIVFRVQCC